MSFLAFQNISKSYGPVPVLHGVSFALQQGEVHAIIGENGAGKSTLMKILSGYTPSSSGELLLDGRPLQFKSNREAEQAGIVLIHQEFNLVEDLSITDNIFLGRELKNGLLLNDAAMQAQAKALLLQVGLDLDPRTRVRDLIIPHKQLVEIARALSRQARVLILDEPTATLTPTETDVLFSIMQELKSKGVTLLYISHKLDEVSRISDRVTVLRDGRFVTTRHTPEVNQLEMANLLVGRDLQDMFPEKAVLPEAKKVLEVRHVTVPGWAKDVSFDLREGEILGFAGLVGAGRTELFEGLLGLRPRTSGKTIYRGKELKIHNPRDAAKAGLVYLSEDRKGKGLLMDSLLRPNLTLSVLSLYAKPLLNFQAEQRALDNARMEYNIRADRSDTFARSLSGGNQQKLALAKIMQLNPDVIILDEPTRGVDIGAKREIYFLMAKLAWAGRSVIVISSELPELLGLCHRIVVMRQGEVMGVLEGKDLSETEVIQHATGVKRGDVHVTA
ncbi:sugar ABC transporter ATP-binding protein [Deinococcus roseus]|uniref:ABC transporter ATP-binding protein n=1 Tax=Deinococcus roseus TaxID=392414 RepID=A0ABQ2CWB0_9DEIO|nr:sugar ABC transporter ATP-binding protein [Deinococcus roseus]GGJ26995.1 ABC transporter ATP-binding protein [Deinococcus roseus]